MRGQTIAVPTRSPFSQPQHLGTRTPETPQAAPRRSIRKHALPSRQRVDVAALGGRTGPRMRCGLNCASWRLHRIIPAGAGDLPLAQHLLPRRHSCAILALYSATGNNHALACSAPLRPLMLAPTALSPSARASHGFADGLRIRSAGHLAMVTVGLASTGGRAVWLARKLLRSWRPAGFGIAALGSPVKRALVESGCGLLAFGMMVALRLKAPLAIAVAIVRLFFVPRLCAAPRCRSGIVGAFPRVSFSQRHSPCRRHGLGLIGASALVWTARLSPRRVLGCAGRRHPLTGHQRYQALRCALMLIARTRAT
jgi:hypothetical protein